MIQTHLEIEALGLPNCEKWYNCIKFGESSDRCKTIKKTITNNHTKSNIVVLNKLLSFLEDNDFVTGIFEIGMTYQDQDHRTYDIDCSCSTQNNFKTIQNHVKRIVLSKERINVC